MAFWKFLDYVTENHTSPISMWYGSVGRDVQAAFDILVQELAGTEDWDFAKKRKYRELKRQHTGMCELIFKVGQRKFRPLGILRRDLREFIFLGACEHQRGNSIPPNAFDDAFKLMGEFLKGKGAPRDHV
jgi:hypothetical protein